MDPDYLDFCQYSYIVKFKDRTLILPHDVAYFYKDEPLIMLTKKGLTLDVESSLVLDFLYNIYKGHLYEYVNTTNIDFLNFLDMYIPSFYEELIVAMEEPGRFDTVDKKKIEIIKHANFREHLHKHEKFTVITETFCFDFGKNTKEMQVKRTFEDVKYNEHFHIDKMFKSIYGVETSFNRTFAFTKYGLEKALEFIDIKIDLSLKEIRSTYKKMGIELHRNLLIHLLVNKCQISDLTLEQISKIKNKNYIADWLSERLVKNDPLKSVLRKWVIEKKEIDELDEYF